MRIIPEQRKPDLRAIRKHLKETGEVLTGTEVEMQPDKLSWETNNINFERNSHEGIQRDSTATVTTSAA